MTRSQQGATDCAGCYYGLQRLIKRQRRELQTLSLPPLFLLFAHGKGLESRHVFFIIYLNVGLTAAFRRCAKSFKMSKAMHLRAGDTNNKEV